MEVRIEDGPCGCPRFQIEPPFSDSPGSETVYCVHTEECKSGGEPTPKKKATKKSHKVRSDT